MYTSTQLDGMTLSERVALATQGEIPWAEVNRAQADIARAREEKANEPLHTKLARTPLCRSSREYRRRRFIRLNAHREELMRVEHLLKRSVHEDNLRKAARRKERVA